MPPRGRGRGKALGAGRGQKKSPSPTPTPVQAPKVKVPVVAATAEKKKQLDKTPEHTSSSSGNDSGSEDGSDNASTITSEHDSEHTTERPKESGGKQKKKRIRMSKYDITKYPHWGENENEVKLAAYIESKEQFYRKGHPDWLNSKSKALLYTEIGQQLNPVASGKCSFFSLL